MKRVKKHLSWVATKPKYSQLVREANKEKRVLWVWEAASGEGEVPWHSFTDESTVQLDNHGHFCFRKQKQPQKLKPRSKHQIKSTFTVGWHFKLWCDTCTNIHRDNELYEILLHFRKRSSFSWRKDFFLHYLTYIANLCQSYLVPRATVDITHYNIMLTVNHWWHNTSQLKDSWSLGTQ